MTPAPSRPGSELGASGLRALLERVRYEVLPAKVDRGQGSRPRSARRRRHRDGVAGQGAGTDPRPRRAAGGARLSRRPACAGPAAAGRRASEGRRRPAAGGGSGGRLRAGGRRGSPGRGLRGCPAGAAQARRAGQPVHAGRRHGLSREPSVHPRRRHRPGHVGQARARHVHRQQPVLRRAGAGGVGRSGAAPRGRAARVRGCRGACASGRSCCPWRRRSGWGSRPAS